MENPWLGLYLLVMTLSGTFGIGFAFAALTLRIKETAQTVANFLQFALTGAVRQLFPLLCPAPVYPVHFTPATARLCGGCLPFDHDGFPARLP